MGKIFVHWNKQPRPLFMKINTMLLQVIAAYLAPLLVQASPQNEGCLFDGYMYSKGEHIIVKPCLAELTCLGNNLYSQRTMLGGECPQQKRHASGQSGCVYDGRVYSKGDVITVQPCLAQLTCLGDNNFSEVTMLGGICPKETREVDGQSGCLFDGRVYAKDDVITIQPCLAQMTCLGNNAYSDLQSLGGKCQ